MKAYLKNQFRGYSGKMDGCVAYYHSLRDAFLVRSLPKFVPNSRTRRMQDVMANLKKLNPATSYKQDFKDYLILYNQMLPSRQQKLISWSNIYLKMLYALQKANPDVDLAMLSRMQIETENLPCRNLKAAIEAGLLPVVAGYAQYINNI